ncbi:hypothetical protein ACE1CI_27475 [Aerosakkonemataceae cyanobacterium BLCC-F50]|uniref:Uncharacterized protein n=1 Tax=Floridaenema flaviceps BLCC-F50 TaxID=3153642 RepID=A0ABV4XY63_9CYAN
MTQADLKMLTQTIHSFSQEHLNDSLVQSKHSRRRGVILTEQGLQKLTKSNVLCDKYGNRYSYEVLAGFSQLDPRTVSRILSCETKIDKRTLKIFFNAFNLQLEMDDYTTPESDSVPDAISINELMQLKEGIMQDYNRLINLLNLDNPGILI